MVTQTATATSSSTDGGSNKLEFLPRGLSVLPWEWKGLGGAFTAKGKTAQSLTSRCSFVVREGFDPIDQSSTGRVLEGGADLGITVRKDSLALAFTVGGLSWRSGLDDPLAVEAAGLGNVGTIPSLKATVAKEVAEDQFLALSYDFKLKKPEVSACWSGSTFTERATLCVHADPLYRTYRLGAAVEMPGPEWRNTVYDEEKDVIEEPKDDGARHKLWLQHEVKDRDWMHSTRAGAVIDLGRMVNYLADYVDYGVEPRIPPLFWAIPFSHKLYNLLVPAEDDEQVRHRIKGWDLEVAHDFARSAPTLALGKRMKYATLAATWDPNAKEMGMEYSRSGLRLGARLGRHSAAEGGGWKNPSLHLQVEPLSLL